MPASTPPPVLTARLQSLFAGAAGGAVSTLTFYSAVHGGAGHGGGLGLLLLPLVPLPMLIAGFGWGVPAAGTAAAVMAAVLLAIAPATLAIACTLALGLPVWGITYLLSLARFHPDGTVDWFPAGRVVMAIALYGAALPVLLFALGNGDTSTIAPEMTVVLQRLVDRAPAGSYWRTLRGQDLASLVAVWAQLLPAMIACYWTLVVTIDVYLAARVVHRSGLLVCPWPDLHWLTYPAGLVALPVLAAVGVLLGGSPRALGIGALGAALIAFTVQGLSVIHAIAHARSATWAIAAAYAALIAFNGIGLLLIAGLGFTDTLLRVRARLVPLPADLPQGSL